MAESEKKASSLSASKEKKSMLDDGIGKEFLSSWKSISVAENDAMDFGFDTIPSGKKSAFDFGKLDDMDFSLDNDFGKFKVDMSDLDFSTSTKKVTKPKDQHEGESSSKKHNEKDDPFNFSFDFNDMDDFNLDSTLKKQKNAPKSNLDRKTVASDKSELRNCSIDLDVDGRVAAFDEGQNKKVSAAESVHRGSSMDLDIDGGVAAFDEGQNKKVSAVGSVLKPDKSVLRSPSTDLDIDGEVAALDDGQNNMKVSASGSVLKSDKGVLRSSSIDRDIDGGVAAFDEGENKKVSASGSTLKPDVETAPGCTENREVSIEKSPSNTFGSHATSSLDRNCTVNKENQQVPFSGKTSPAVSSAKETSQISTGQSLGGNHLSKDNVSSVEMEVDSLESKLPPESVLQQFGNDRMVTHVSSERETSESKDSDSPFVIGDEHTEVESDTSSTMLKENHLETESVAHGCEIEAIPTAVLSPSISKERTDHNSNEDWTAKISAAPESDLVVEKVKLIKGRETAVVRSKFFRRSEEPEPQVCQPLPVNEKASILESQGIAVLTSNSLGTGKSKDLGEGESQNGRNTSGDSKSLSRDSDKGESALAGRERNVKNLSNMRIGLTETGNRTASKLPAKSRLLEKESNKVNSIMLGSTKLRDLNNFSSDNPAISTDRTSEPSNQTSENSKTSVSSTRSKILSLGGSTVKKTDLSSFMLLRTSVSSKAQTDSSQEFNSLKNLQKIVEQRSMELPVKLVSSKAQADASHEFSSLKNAQKSVELPVKFVSRKAQADVSQEFSSLKKAQKRVELPEKLVSSKAQTDSSLEFSSLKNSQKSVELPSNKDQTDASQEFGSLKNTSKSAELPAKFLSSKAQTVSSREFSSLENLKRSVELPIKFVSASTHPVSKTRNDYPGITSLKHKTLEASVGEAMPLNLHKHISQTPRESRLSPSLKRKTLEGPAGEAVPLNPHKRLSQSPKDSRYSAEPIKSAVDEQNNTNMVEDNGTTSEQEMAMDVNVKELEISLTMENDGNAEKAETYAKELENICNMLKKKHEEAKEMMVRAIVNNNSLLMLNHPIFDEKIRNVQKLLAKLTMSN